MINGRVTVSDGQAANNLIIKAFDRNLGEKDTLLGQAATDAQGSYSMVYSSGKLDGKSAADLVICLYQDDNLLQTSDVIFNAQADVTKDFIVILTPESEFNHLTKIIQPLLRNKIQINRLAQTQINFLGLKTGIDAKKISFLAQSNALAENDQTLATFYYGLLSQNIPTEPESLLKIPLTSLREALDYAAALNQIPRLQPQDLVNILNTTLPRLRSKNILKPALSGQKASLGDLLKTIPQTLSESCQMKVADLISQHGIDYNQLPEQLKSAGLSSSEALSVERTLKLADVTLSNTPLMQHLHQIATIDIDGSLKSLTSLGKDQWIDMAYAYDLSAQSGQSPEEYGMRLESAIEALHPTTMLAARLNSGDLVIERPGFNKILTFLNNNPDFEITNTNIPVFMGKANLNEIENRDEIVLALIKLQRVKKISSTWNEAGALLNTKLDSAIDIVALGKERLQQRLSTNVATEQAGSIYQSAKRIHDVSLAMMSQIMPRFSPTPVAAMGMSTLMSETTINNTLNDFPSLQEIFGSLDYCDCDPNRSVLSPAAYFVDLLQFLTNTETVNTLLGRRPDLADLELSSENTGTELPYIDLVIETLENAIAMPLMNISLPAGRSGAIELNKTPLPPDILHVLQRTSLETIGTELTAVKVQKKVFDFDGIDTYTVIDQPTALESSRFFGTWIGHGYCSFRVANPHPPIRDRQ